MSTCRLRYSEILSLEVGMVLRSRLRPNESGVRVLQLGPWKNGSRWVQVECLDSGQKFDWSQGRRDDLLPYAVEVS